MSQAPAFRFDEGPHHYILEQTGELVTSITGMLKVAKRPDGKPWVDDRWFDQASRERGDWVHAQTARYDLGLLENVADVRHEHKGYLLAHVAAMQAVRPTILKVEEPGVHSVFRFGGRIDRVLLIQGLRSIWEIKTGDPEPSHQIQTALEALLESDSCGVPATSIRRRCCYLKADGGFKVKEHTDRRDHTEALNVLKQCGLRAA